MKYNWNIKYPKSYNSMSLILIQIIIKSSVDIYGEESKFYNTL